ncbi:hypothetical protein Scep_030631 [Stephania cephalantha]|uniref:Disease resistance N-terminal domain-containing protein n=1 Tax=Stephania cephalantha TaxID=152367 RepID=A0AAP0DZZ1_9MAGN
MWVDPEDQINPFVQVLALKACGHKAELVHGRLFHCYSVKTGFVNSVELVALPVTIHQMAEVVVEAVVGLLFENLKSIIQRELDLVWGFKADIRKLSATLSPLHEVLADAEVKQIKSKAIRKWLARLKHAAYDAQDVLDDWAIAETNRIRYQLRTIDATGTNYRAHLVWSSFMSFINLKRLVFRYKLAKQIKEIRERFDGIAKEMSRFFFDKEVGGCGGIGGPSSIH